ncbi:type II toxin-antitoxin system HicA family toxin [Arthrobacter globiformis]|uniref:type II toxin-antitoxin system HicA family toxin n=1 Tax=Arthrobacter globiformis TaxID=1665 RepID=UPI000B410D91
MGSSDFPSMDPKKLRRLIGRLGYTPSGNGKGSHERLECPGRPPLTWGFHAGKEIAGGLVKQILMKQIGLTKEEALEVLRGK